MNLKHQPGAPLAFALAPAALTRPLAADHPSPSPFTLARSRPGGIPASTGDDAGSAKVDTMTINDHGNLVYTGHSAEALNPWSTPIAGETRVGLAFDGRRLVVTSADVAPSEDAIDRDAPGPLPRVVQAALHARGLLGLLDHGYSCEVHDDRVEVVPTPAGKAPAIRPAQEA